MRRFAILTMVAVFSGCSTAPGPQPVNQSSSTQGQTGPAAPMAPSAPGAPAGSAAASEDAPSQPLDDRVSATKAAYEKNPNDAAAKAAYADATFQNAQFYMYKSPLPPNQKYPKALALYRETLRLDPSNQQAQEAISMIESIYRSLNKPVPPAA